MRIRIAAIVLFGLTSMVHLPVAFATRIDLMPNQADPGGSVDMCAVLSGNGTTVGFQVDLQWDDRCVFPVLATSGNPQCSANLETGKSVFTYLLSRRTRVMMLALFDSASIPNGPLFCCTFSVLQVPRGATCSFAFANVSGTDKDGNKSTILAQGADLSIRAGDSPASLPQGGGAEPPPAGAGVTHTGAHQSRPGAAALAPPRRNKPAPTSAPPALAPLTQHTPSEIAPEVPPAGTLVGAEAAQGQAADRELTPALGMTVTTPQATAPASTPTRGIEATRSAAIATQTRTSVATPVPATTTPVK